MMKKYIIIALLTVFSYSVVAQQPTAPEIRQIIVDETGGVTLFWTPNTDSIDFVHSEVWYQQIYSPDFPDFNKVPDSESPYDSSFYYPDAQANSRPTSYRIVNYYTVNDDTLAINSEDVSAIYLTACLDPVYNRINLEWNSLHHLWTEPFYIYRQAGTGSEWEFIDSTAYTFYHEDVPGNFSNYSYRVYYKDKPDPAAFVSNITDPISYNKYQPVTPSITSIEILYSGTYPNGVATRIEWKKSPSNNVVGYVIYRQKGPNQWDEVGVISSPDIFHWFDILTTAKDCEEIRVYGVAAKGGCNDAIGTNYPDSSKSTLISYAPEYETCDSVVVLRWEPYTDMAVDRYEIYVLDNDSVGFIKYAEVIGDTTYSYPASNKTGFYCFKVRAVHERGEGETPQTITSCQYCLEIDYPQTPASGFFRHVSVAPDNLADNIPNNIPDNIIQLCFEVDASADSPTYRIERSATGIEDTYEIIATLPPTGAAVMTYIDADPALKTQNISYHYRLYTLNSCEHSTDVKTVQTILLSAMEDESHNVVLEWNPYDDYDSELLYTIYRYINNQLDNTFSITTTSLSYYDTDLQLSDQTLSFAYRIAAVGKSDYMNALDTAFSNIAPLKRLQTDIWFPNAFSPTGSNKIFRPIYSGIEVETYELTIFNRYGAAIYQTVEPGGGWDGKINGTIATAGGYGYMLKIKAKNGDRIERRGSMILIN